MWKFSVALAATAFPAQALVSNAVALAAALAVKKKTSFVGSNGVHG
jgi:hypothetical protein